MSFERPPRNLVDKLLQYSTPTVSDALDRLGLPGGCESITPVWDGARMAGPAYTIHYVPVDRVSPRSSGDYVDSLEPGDVVAIDNAGRTYCSVWGSIMSIAAQKRGVAGTVIDGACRDVDVVRRIRYPIFSKGRFMMTGRDRIQLAGENVPVTLSKVLVNPGDVVMGDDTGVLVVPQSRLEEILRHCEQIHEAELAIEGMVEKGATLKEARDRYRYHELPRRLKQGQ